MAHGLRAQDVRDHGAPVREIRPDGRGALRAEFAAQGTQHTAYTALRRKVRQRLAQLDRLAEVHDGVAAVEEHVQQLAKAPEQHPFLGEHQPPQALLLLGCAPEVDRHRDEVEVEARFPAGKFDQLHELAGRTPPQTCTEERALTHEREAAVGLRDAECGARVVENREIAAALVLEYVADGPTARGDRLGDLLGLDGHPDPQAEDFSNGEAPRPSEAAERAHGEGRLPAAAIV